VPDEWELEQQELELQEQGDRALDELYEQELEEQIDEVCTEHPDAPVYFPCD
jgi:hypothetical protein